MGRRCSIHLNQKFQNLTVLEIIPSNKSGKHSNIRCLCNCGKETIIQSHFLKKQISCGCKKDFWNDLTDNFFGKLKVLKLLEKNSKSNGKQGHLYLCECIDCKKEYKIRATALKRKKFLGCRCDPDKKSSKIKTYNSYKSNAKNRNLKFSLNFRDFVFLCEKKCFYCGSIESNNSKSSNLNIWKRNGLDRIDNRLGYTKNNVCTCCKTCNWMKNKLSQTDFLNHIKKIISWNLPVDKTEN